MAIVLRTRVIILAIGVDLTALGGSGDVQAGVLVTDIHCAGVVVLTLNIVDTASWNRDQSADPRLTSVVRAHTVVLAVLGGDTTTLNRGVYAEGVLTLVGGAGITIIALGFHDTTGRFVRVNTRHGLAGIFGARQLIITVILIHTATLDHRGETLVVWTSVTRARVTIFAVQWLYATAGYRLVITHTLVADVFGTEISVGAL